MDGVGRVVLYLALVFFQFERKQWPRICNLWNREKKLLRKFSLDFDLSGSVLLRLRRGVAHLTPLKGLMAIIDLIKCD